MTAKTPLTLVEQHGDKALNIVEQMAQASTLPLSYLPGRSGRSVSMISAPLFLHRAVDADLSSADHRAASRGHLRCVSLDCCLGLPTVSLDGLSVASQFLLRGDFITANRVAVIGLVNHIVAPEQLLNADMDLTSNMLKSSSEGLRMTKETRNAVIDAGSLEAGLTLEDRQDLILLNTNDHHDAVTAFRERRYPRSTTVDSRSINPGRPTQKGLVLSSSYQ